MIIELEDLIVNALIQLHNYKTIRRVSGATIKECINIIDKNLNQDGTNIKISDRKDCMNTSRYFDVRYNSDFDVEYILKDNITISDLNVYNFNLSNEVLSIFKSDYFLKSLGIVFLEETPIEQLILQVVHDTTTFYFQIASKLKADEYYYIKDRLQHKKCENCIKINCESRYVNLVCDDWDNREIVGRCKILRDYNVFNLKK